MFENEVDPVYRTWHAAILRICLHHLDDRDDAEDATQETFRRGLQQDLATLDDPLRWLTTVARNVCFDELRRRRSRRAALQRTVGGEDAAVGTTADPERVVVGRALVTELLGRLTPAERSVVGARLIDDRAGPELAAALGVTPSTVRVLLARGLGKLRTYLADGQSALGGVLTGAWRAAGQLRRALLDRLRLLGSGGSDGPGLVQGLALLSAAIAALCLCVPGSATRAQAAPRPQQPAPPALAPAGATAHTAQAAAATAARAGAPPAPSPAPPPPVAPRQAPAPAPPPPQQQQQRPFQPTDLVPQGPLVQSAQTPQQGIQVGKVYIMIVPGPWFSQLCSTAPENVQVRTGPSNPRCSALP